MFIAIDIGGTNTRVASSQNLRDVDNIETFLSQRTLDAQKDKVRNAIEIVSKGEKIKGVAVGVAGIINKGELKVEESPNYRALDGASMRDLIGIYDRTVNLSCTNDAELAALGEAVLGVGSPFDSVAYLSLGTGVGGACIHNKKLDIFSRNVEPGHQIINVGSTTKDSMGVAGSLETYISGPSFERIYGQKPEKCTDKKIWHEYGKNVGVGIYNLSLLWDFDCVVIGGGISANFERFDQGIMEFLQDKNSIRQPKVLKAVFGQQSGVIGGFVLLSQRSLNRI